MSPSCTVDWRFVVFHCQFAEPMSGMYIMELYISGWADLVAVESFSSWWAGILASNRTTTSEQGAALIINSLLDACCCVGSVYVLDTELALAVCMEGLHSMFVVGWQREMSQSHTAVRCRSGRAVILCPGSICFVTRPVTWYAWHSSASAYIFTTSPRLYAAHQVLGTVIVCSPTTLTPSLLRPRCQIWQHQVLGLLCLYLCLLPW